MTVEVSSIRKYTQLNFDKKCFVFDWTRMWHIYYQNAYGHVTLVDQRFRWRHINQRPTVVTADIATAHGSHVSDEISEGTEIEVQKPTEDGMEIG